MISSGSIDASYYGWIPNLAGNATERKRIEELMGSSDKRSEYHLIYELYEDEEQPSMAISPVDSPGILIAPIDEHGMCLIELSTKPMLQTIGIEDRFELVRRCWTDICEKLGDDLGLGFGYVGSPIPFTEDTDVYNGVADAFIAQSMKNLGYICYNISFRMSLRYFQRDVRFDTKLSYYRRYLFMYSEQIGSSLPEYRSLAVRLSEIKGIIEKSIERRYRIRVDLVMALFALATLIASVMLSAVNFLK